MEKTQLLENTKVTNGVHEESKRQHSVDRRALDGGNIYREAEKNIQF